MGALKIFNGSGWEYVSLPVGGVTIQPGAPTAPTVGQLWLDSDDSVPGNIADTGWISVASTVGFQNGWVDYDARTVRYRRLNGVVYIEGLAKNGTAGSTIFTLPQGFRCSNRLFADKNLLINRGGVAGLLTIGGDGRVSDASGGATLYVDLNGIPPYVAEN